jgi:ribosome maturation protein SDO1
LQALPLLKSRFPIDRARMRLRLLVPLNAKDEVYELLAKRGGTLEERDLVGSMLSVTCLVEPGAYRAVHALVQAAGGGGRVEVVAVAATAEEPALEPLTFGGAQPDAAAPQPVVIDMEAMAAAPPPAAAAPPAPAPARRRMQADVAQAPAVEQIVYARGPVEGLPEEHASRRERFAELDALQAGWTVELRSRSEGGTVEAVFFSPAGDRVGSYAMARRAAMQASKELAAA